MQMNILTFPGSSRRDSLNQRILDAAAAGALDAGAHVSKIRLRDFELPVYDGDWEVEHGLPDGTLTLKKLAAEHHAFLIATPEHNGGYTAMLKNAVDWISRPSKDDPTGLAPFAGKAAALVSASPGPFGGLRSQLALQVSLSKLGVIVMPNSFALGTAYQAFDEQAHFKDQNVESTIRVVGTALARTTAVIAHGGQ